MAVVSGFWHAIAHMLLVFVPMVALELHPVEGSHTVGIGVYEHDSEAVVRQGEWKVAASRYDHGMSTGYTADENASASLTFTGSRIRWISRTSPTSGMVDVYLDGIRTATVDLYTSRTRFSQVVFEKKFLAQGTHTIKIVRTGRSNEWARSGNIVLDAMVVAEATSPAAPTNVSVSPDRTGLRVRWDAPPDDDVVGYFVYRRQTSLDSWILISGAQPVPGTALTDVALGPKSPYQYAVRAVDREQNRSKLSGMASGMGPPSFSLSTAYRYDNCPSPTFSVSDNDELQWALELAEPGDVIKLADGTYDPFDVSGVVGAPDRPVWICGSESAVVDRRDPQVASGIYMTNSEHVVVAGLTVRRSRKGVMVDRSENVVIADLHVSDIGEEGIHLRRNTSHSWVVGNTVERTGLVNEEFGEGIYIGSSTTNWCEVNDCDADQADHNIVLDNVVREVTAEGIEAKEGTWGGTIAGNTIDGRGMTADAGGFVLVKGNEWLIVDNDGTGAPGDGMRVVPTNDDLGLDNQFVGNHMSLTGNGFGIHAPYVEKETVVACNNSVDRSNKGVSNVVCQP